MTTDDTSSTPGSDADTPERPHRPRSVLTRHPDFRRLFVGNSVSLLGSSVTAVAMPLTAVVYLHASATQMGLLGAVALLPHLVLGLPAGVWVDRIPYRRLIVLADLAQALLLGSIPVLALTGLLQIWHLYVVVVLAGICNLFETVAAQSFTPSLVTRDQLLPANSALMMSTATVNTTGSALGGMLVTLLTAPLAIAADAVSFLVAGVCKVRIRNPGRVVSSHSDRKRRLWADVGYGLRVVFTHRILRAVTVAATIGALAGQMQGVILVLYLVREVGLSSALVGAAIAAGGVAAILGAVLTTPLTRRIGPGPTFVIGTLLASVAGFVLASATGPLLLTLAILLVAQVLRGVGPSLYGVNQQTFRQTLVAPAVISRVNATWRFLVHGMQVFGALLGGLAGSALGLRTTLVVSSGIMLAGTAIAFVSPLRTLRELPAPEVDQVASAR